MIHWPGKKTNLNPVLFVAHYDVVPVEGQKWTKDPFGGEIDKNFIYGRGSVDDKSSVIALLEATELALKNHWQPERSLYYVIGHDEEVGGLRGAQSIAKAFQDQGLKFDFILDEGGIITNGSKLGIQNDVALIGIAQKGYSDLELIARAQAGHSSMPESSTAIGQLANGIQTIEATPFPASITGVFQKTLESLIPYASPFQKWVLSNLWLTSSLIEARMKKSPATNAFIRTSQAFTVIQGGSKANVLPSEARANLNLRLLPGESLDGVKQRIKKIVSPHNIEVLQNHLKDATEASSVSPIDSDQYQLIQMTGPY